MSSPFLELFNEGQQYFRNFIEEFKVYGIEADPAMELRKSPGMHSYYDLNDGHIYLSVLDDTTTSGKLSKIFLRSLLRCENDEELLQFLRIFTSHIIAHEMGHHFRHRYGLFDNKNLWHEEQIANQLAVAVTKYHLSPAERNTAKYLLQRAIEGLAEKMDKKDVATDSYHSIVIALNATGELHDETMDSIEIMQRIFAVKPEQLLINSGQFSPELVQRIGERNDIIGEINEEYTSDIVKYMYYHLGWLYCDLTSHETSYISEFAQKHLNQGEVVLPVPVNSNYVDEWEIQAMYKAYQDVFEKSETARRYFYKRYRSLLVAKLQTVKLNAPSQADELKRELALLLEKWDEQDDDVLNYLSLLAPPGLRRLFPHMIETHLSEEVILPDHLPTETDKRLWEYVSREKEDEGAEQTLHRLRLLDQTTIYRKLPAEVVLELAHMLYRVKLATGETIIWENEQNNDVYILLKGDLKVVVNRTGTPQYVGTVYPGDVFGEMAFFTNEPRSASVTAYSPVECFALKSSDLQLLTYRHPAILMHMARTLAARLDRLNSSVTNTRRTFVDNMLATLVIEEE